MQARLEYLIPNFSNRIIRPHLIKKILRLNLAGIHFEEVPLLECYSDINFITETIPEKLISSLLLNVAELVVDNLNLFAVNNITNNPYIYGLTLCDFEEDLEECGYIIPNILICDATMKSIFKDLCPISSAKTILLKNIYGNMLNNSQLILKQSVTKDQFGDIHRIYIMNQAIVNN